MKSSKGDEVKPTRRRFDTKVLLRRWGPVGIVLLIMGIGYLYGAHEHFTLNTLIKHRNDLMILIQGHPFVSAVSYIVVYVVVVALSFPGAAVLSIAGGFLFGWILGGGLTVFAATVGATVIYLIARSSVGSTLEKRSGAMLQKMAAGFRDNAFYYLLFLRLTPIFPFWLVNIAPAAFNVGLGTYFFATALGILPGTFAYTLIGSGLDSLIIAQEATDPGCALAGRCQVHISALITPQILGAFAALGIVSLIPVLLKTLRQKRIDRNSSDKEL
ncbi:TVP38/TMEM64 family protein [Flexibacterium corallicola]|uniref:TVP38/TMEM64 family protein n=1 Tax=Flexibacterium corallicola TaxID=3037259 RepID=UPI00286FAC82|nr:VTT domain-containing protein [Pseudovibrio sp. M1P-2-3]